jgi:hypothetical protein
MRVRGFSAVKAMACMPLMLACAVLHAQSQPSGPGIYTCTDAAGKRITSDRPIANCNDRDQRLLNRDGSTRQIVPPPMTADERAAAEAREQQEALQKANQREAIRRDRNLLARFPNEAAHKKARESALDDIRKALKNSERRLDLLEKERRPLMDESEFYVGRQLPGKLRQQIEANDAATDAQRSLLTTQKAEIVRIDALYDAELQRLRKLWSGAQPGSMGTLPKSTSGATGAAAASAPPGKGT